MEVIHTDCRNEEGITIGLIDALISICRVLSPRLSNISENEYSALKDLHNDNDLLKILRSGPHNVNLKRTSTKKLLKELDNLENISNANKYLASLKRSEHFPVRESIVKAFLAGVKS